MNKRSERVDGKTRSRNAPAATQEPEITATDARSGERAAGPRRRKTPAGATARKRRPPFVL